MNKTIIRQYMDEIWNERKLEKVYDVFADDVTIHSPLGDFKTAKTMHSIVSKWVQGIPDIHVTLLNTVEEDDLVISHWKATGTHQKEINDLPAKGNPVDYQGVTMYRLQNGKVVEYWAYIDSVSLNQQMSA